MRERTGHAVPFVADDKGDAVSEIVERVEAGCTTQQVGAITGQSDEIVAYYARGVDQKRLARAAMEKLEAWTRGGTE